MNSPTVLPGPAADETFDLGLRAATAAMVAAVASCYASGHLSAAGATLLLVLGLPTCLVVVSCLLGVWLGYDKQALARLTTEVKRT
jgi:hypothetical protein